MYAAAHARPDGESTVARLALTAATDGYGGLVVRNHGDRSASYDATAIGQAYEIDVVSGIEIRADDPSRASGYLGSHRPTHEVVLVHGGDPAINRFAVAQPAVDVLAHPTRDGADFDHVLAKTAASNGVRVEISLRPVLQASGGTRVRAIRDCRRLWELIDHYDVPYVVSVDASSHLELRAPRDLVGLGEILGVGAAAIEAGLEEWGRLAARNRDRLGEGFIEPGVHREEP